MLRLTKRIAVGAAAVTVLAMAAVAASAPVSSPTADYRFLNSLASSVGSPPPLANLNIHGNRNNRFEREVVDPGQGPRSVLSFPKGNGLVLSPTTGVVGNGTYTIVLRFRLDNTDGWRRLVDFKHGTDDSGLYVLNGTLQLYPYQQGPDGALQPDTYATVALTRDASGTVVGYVNGVQQFSVDDSGNQYGVIDPSNMLRFFRDNDQGPSTGEESGGAVARILLYNSALSSSAVAALDASVPLPVITVDPAQVARGSSTSVTGHNFLAGDTVHLAIVHDSVSTPLGDAVTGADGSFVKSVQIPQAEPIGNARITATGSWGGTVSQNIRVSGP